MSDWNGYCCYCGAIGHRPANCRWAGQRHIEQAPACHTRTHIQIRYKRGDPAAPVGTVLELTELKPGFLVANGARVSKTIFADLYAVIGDRWSTPDDASVAPDMFRLPDYRLRSEG